jgi:polyisoprenoid-binding protein YceI
MRTLLSIAAVILFTQNLMAQNQYTTRSGHISFFSKAPVADVDAQNEKVRIDLNAKTGEIAFTMNMKDFQFKNEKMEKDATDKYLETEKYTAASFKGKLEGKIDYDKAGTYDVVAIGKLTVHGVTTGVKEKGTLTVGKGQVKLQSQFNLALKDFNIDQPEILGKKMTEEKVLVKVAATLSAGGDTALKKD